MARRMVLAKRSGDQISTTLGSWNLGSASSVVSERWILVAPAVAAIPMTLHGGEAALDRNRHDIAASAKQALRMDHGSRVGPQPEGSGFDPGPTPSWPSPRPTRSRPWSLERSATSSNSMPSGSSKERLPEPRSSSSGVARRDQSGPPRELVSDSGVLSGFRKRIRILTNPSWNGRRSTSLEA